MGIFSSDDVADNSEWISNMTKAELEERLEKALELARVRGEALKPFVRYYQCRRDSPLRGLNSIIHAIHMGTKYEADITLSNCEEAFKALNADLPIRGK